MTTTPQFSRRTYVDAVLNLYARLPGTRPRPTRQDRRLAASLYDREVPFSAVRTALLLAVARRTLRDKDAPPLPPIGCLHYFVPVLDEVLAMPPDPSYADYLMTKLQPFLKTTSSPGPPVSTTGQKSPYSRGR
jgi:hypothetical protein